MFRISLCIVAVVGAVTSASIAHAQDEPEQALSLQEAVNLALQAQDPTVTRFAERASALDERAVADSQLPDPKLRLGLMNWPTNSFRYTQEPMTQIQVGVKQAFPRGKTLSYTRQRREAEARAARAQLGLQQSQIVLDTRTAWLELYYWLGARGKVAASRQAVSELVEVATSVYASGRQTSQDVFRAELELSLLDDRMVDVERRIEIARADLSRLTGAAAAKQFLPTSFSLRMPAPREILAERLAYHPSVDVEDARIDARDRDIDIARQQYKPGWSVDVGYGARGADRADFASVGVAVDLPFFTGKRQDRRVAAAKRDRQAARLERDARILELTRRLDRTHADWVRQGERIELYQQVVTVRAAGTTEAALGAYRAGVSDFAELIRSRLAELDADLKLLRLIVDRGQAQAHLMYLDGGNHE